MKVLNPIYNVIYYVLLGLAQLLVRILYPIKAIGKENLKIKGTYVLTCNHLFAIDPMFVLLARGLRKKMLIMGKEELFGINPPLDFFWKVVGAFPIDRGAGDRGTVEAAMREVKKGRGLLIFPEGTRSKDGKLKRLKSGAFVVAMEAGADMIPSYIHYKGGRPRPFHRVTVVFGKPVTMEEMGLVGEYSVAKLRQAKELFTGRMLELQEGFAAGTIQ